MYPLRARSARACVNPLLDELRRHAQAAALGCVLGLPWPLHRQHRPWPRLHPSYIVIRKVNDASRSAVRRDCPAIEPIGIRAAT